MVAFILLLVPWKLVSAYADEIVTKFSRCGRLDHRNLVIENGEVAAANFNLASDDVATTVLDRASLTAYHMVPYFLKNLLGWLLSVQRVSLPISKEADITVANHFEVRMILGIMRDSLSVVLHLALINSIKSQQRSSEKHIPPVLELAHKLLLSAKHWLRPLLEAEVLEHVADRARSDRGISIALHHLTPGFVHFGNREEGCWPSKLDDEDAQLEWQEQDELELWTRALFLQKAVVIVFRFFLRLESGRYSFQVLVNLAE